ncbi:MAG TPA: efflux RND transporter periplasmic adaptor subunit [Steroidobacteraceae bacterium]|nr:efflux RND transporter periplasmic adaptor subunit [Steroidobacteraceae bacterium]
MNDPAATDHNYRPVILGAVALLVVALGWIWLARKPTGAGGHAVAAPVVVDVAEAMRSDVPLYLEGLGTVEAFYTAKVAARVDGLLERVNFAEGQQVKKGDVLAQIDPRPLQAALDQAIATKAKDEAQLGTAKLDLDRYIILAPQNLVAAQTVDTQRSLVAQLQAQLNIDQAIIDNARTQRDYTTITAPIAGRTGIRQVDPGNNVHATDTTGIVVVTQLQPISVLFTLPEDSLPGVSKALAAGSVPVMALLRDDKTQLDTGTLALIDNEIDASTGTMRLKATFPNARNTLWPGQFVNVRVLVQQQRGVILLASAAVQRGPDGVFVYVVNPDMTVAARTITTTGEETGGAVVVTAGLQPGERVVTSNQYRLEPGTHVRVQGGAAPAAALAQRTTP